MTTTPVQDTSPRALWRQAVCQAAQTLRDAYPVQVDSIDEAEKLVLGDDLAWAADGSCLIGSQRDPSVTYTVRDQHCTCEAYRFMPGDHCKHIFARLIHQHARDTPTREVEAPHPAPDTPQPSRVVELPEAPASANCYIELEGRQVQLTLRDRDERRLIQRLRTMLVKFPVKPSQQLDLDLPSGSTGTRGAPENAPREGFCPVHQVQMKQRTNDTGSWYSHKVGDTWCRGKQEG